MSLQLIVRQCRLLILFHFGMIGISMLFAPGSSVGIHEKYSFSEVTFFAKKSPANVPQDPKIPFVVK